MLAVLRESQSDHGGVLLYFRVRKGICCGPSYFSKIFLRLVAPMRYSENHYTPKTDRKWFSEGLSQTRESLFHPYIATE